jgi:tight adherence protein C
VFVFAFEVSTLISIAIFGAFAAGAWWIMDMVTSRHTRAEERLNELKNPGRDRLSPSQSRGDVMASLLEKATPRFAKPLEPKSAEEQSKLQQRLSVAGFRRETSASVFLGMKIVLLIAGAILGGGTMLLMSGFTKTTLMRVLGLAGLMFYLPDIIVWFIGRKRKEAIFLSLPDTLDLMVVCVEAGLGLDQAMRRVAEEMKQTYRVICDELNICNFQLQMGRQRNEVLHELGRRTGVDDLRALASILIQADKFGSSVGQALRVQSDSMRTRRRQIAEEKAAKTAVQLIFPLVLFIFPGIFVVLVGPAAVTMVREMLPMMHQTG